MNVKKLLLMMMLTMSSMTSFSQDFLTGEAIIDDHKRQRKVYALRTAVEEANKQLHVLVTDTVKGWKEVNFSLEKYTKSFELISLIVNCAYTAMNVYGTSNYVSGRIGEISSLMTDYYNELLSQGNIESADLFIYKYGNELVTSLYDDVNQLVKSLRDMPLYVNGKVQCTTANLLLIIDNINKTLARIRQHVARAHLKLTGYIRSRLSPFWNRRVFNSRNVATIATDALSNWLNNAAAGSGR